MIGPLEQQPHEDEIKYYNRLFQKKVTESDSDFQKRVTVIKKNVPHLTVWNDNLYRNYITTVEEFSNSDSGDSVITSTTTTITKKKPSRSTSGLDTAEVSYCFLLILSFLTPLFC